MEAQIKHGFEDPTLRVIAFAGGFSTMPQEGVHFGKPRYISHLLPPYTWMSGMIAGPVVVLALVAVLSGAFAQADGAMAERVPVASLAVTDFAEPTPHCTNCVMGNLTVGSDPMGIAFDQLDGDIYVANSNSSSVSVINGFTGQVSATVRLPPIGGPSALTVDTADDYVYVTIDLSNFGCGADNVTAISGETNQEVRGVNLNGEATGVAYDSANGRVYIATPTWGGICVNGGIQMVYGANTTLAGSIQSGLYPNAVCYDWHNQLVYVTNSGSDNVTIINSSTDRTVGSIPVGSEPSGIAFDSSNGQLYVANSNSSSVTMINATTNSVIGSLPVGSDPVGVAVDTSRDFVYVTNLNSNNLTVINGTTDRVEKSITVGSEPYGVAYDDANGFVYVTNSNDSSVSVIAPLGTIRLTAVAIAPSTATLQLNGNFTFTAIPHCSTGTCPSGVAYSWTLSNSLGTLSSANGSSTVFAAGSKTGTAVLTVEATLNGKTAWSNATITITAKFVSSTGFLGLPGFEGYILIGVVVAVVVTAVVVLLLRKRRGAQPVTEKSPSKDLGKEKESRKSPLPSFSPQTHGCGIVHNL